MSDYEDFDFGFTTVDADDVEGGDRSAVSAFVRTETERCFAEAPALHMPGID